MVHSLDNAEGLAKLNEHLTFFSYINGYTPSSEDLEVFNSSSSAPEKSKYPNVARWYKHIQSFSNEKEAFSGHAEQTEETAPEEEEVSVPEEEAPTKTQESKPEADENDIDLFGEDPEAEAEHERAIERKAQEQIAAKKASGKTVIAKSSVTLDVKPYDSETDMKLVEEKVRSIKKEGLDWKASKLVDLCYGIKKLVIIAVVVDDLISVDELQEEIQAFEDVVQSVDIARFDKL